MTVMVDGDEFFELKREAEEEKLILADKDG